MSATPALLLDTCAVIWIGLAQPISKTAREAIQAQLGNRAVHVSPFTAWELSLLVSRNRLNLAMNVEDWFDGFVQRGGLAIAGLPVSVLVDAHTLPGTPPSDPADRIFIATARLFGQAIVTRDRRILDYGDAGLVQTIAC
jgi:PIN domain nuclease of toxin-antitoxin system